MLTIIKSGLMSQWTDGGRKYSQVKGYSQAGAVDWFSFELANALCGNALNSPALEIMAGNIEFSVGKPCLVSITGAMCDVSINNKLIINTDVLLVEKNDIVKLGPAKNGLFSYIAFSLRFDLPLFANSVCGVKREKIGGASEGRAIVDGQKFTVISGLDISEETAANLKDNTRYSSYTPALANFIRSQFTSHKYIPFSFCYQENAFTNLEKQRFLGHTFVLTPYIDKMGVRLTGPSVNCNIRNMTSQPMANGAIQIPGNGMPIIMRNERQTIGGYPVIGTVNSAGLAILSQATAEQRITFVASDFTNSVIWRQLIDIQLKQVLTNAKKMLNI